MKRLTALCLALLLGLCACGAPEPSPRPSPPAQEPSAPPEPVYLDPADYLPSTKDYIQAVVREHVEQIETPGMSDYEKVKAAADYVMALGYYSISPALDVWRWRTAGDTVPTYEEMRGLNMLLFGVETCEGYTAALNMLLEEMGVETRYMTGMTYMARGGLGYHSWSQVKIDGVWYHLDCDLEDNIAPKNGAVIYKYFLKGDATMGASHYWGQRLISLGQLEPGQEEEIRTYYMGESCPYDYPTPPPSQIPINPRPDYQAIHTALQKELEEYESLYGKLEYMELDILPPVFIRYYFQEGVSMEGLSSWGRNYRQDHLLINPPGTQETRWDWTLNRSQGQSQSEGQHST